MPTPPKRIFHPPTHEINGITLRPRPAQSPSKIIDWDAMLPLFNQRKKRTPGYTYLLFARSLNVSESLVRLKFKMIKDRERQERIADNFAEIAEQGSKKILVGIKGAPPQDYDKLTRATALGADRAGFSPQQVQTQIQINNRQDTTVSLPALFEADDAAPATKIFEAEDDVLPSAED